MDENFYGNYSLFLLFYLLSLFFFFLIMTSLNIVVMIEGLEGSVLCIQVIIRLKYIFHVDKKIRNSIYNSRNIYPYRIPFHQILPNFSKLFSKRNCIKYKTHSTKFIQRNTPFIFRAITKKIYHKYDQKFDKIEREKIPCNANETR